MTSILTGTHSYLHFHLGYAPSPSLEREGCKKAQISTSWSDSPLARIPPPMVKKETRCNITRFVYNTFSRELSASHEYLTTKAVGLSFYNQGEDSVCFEFLMISNQFTHTRLLGVRNPNLGRNHSLSSPNFGTACINPAKNLEQQLWQRRWSVLKLSSM